ncbi:uncharacterized protein LOC143010050 [Genypterus blacodes]|uniref:uncharacterized protein LOC143010050 n=1 Tax=Genypterus blacodes TaxID=154954 RepID=UPI003F770CFD
MKLSTAHHILWSSLLLLWAFETQANDSDPCQDKDVQTDTLIIKDSSGQDDEVGENVDVSCFLYPTNIFNCSISLTPPENEFQVSASVSICEKAKICTLNYSSEDFSPPEPVVLCPNCIDYQKLYIIILYNVSLHNKWTVYANKYKTAKLEVLSAPPNITAWFRDGGLLVTWSQPDCRVPTTASCFNYELDIGDQETPKSLKSQLSYTEPNVDPSRPIRVRMRTRKRPHCHGSNEWSEWSDAVTVTPTKSIYKVNTLVIVTISLGIPMMLLAVLLLVRSQRVSKVLFPPIPGPPRAYKHFLQTNDMFIARDPVLPLKHEEVITEVEDTEQNPLTHTADRPSVSAVQSLYRSHR